MGERAFVRYLDGGCSSPIAAHAIVDDEEMTLLGLYYDESTGNYKKGSIKGAKQEAESLGIALAKQLQEACRKDGGRR